ncbi:MAG: hypothetical protein ACRD0J_09855, partial [Acidimicrobiales bacterium]
PGMAAAVVDISGLAPRHVGAGVGSAGHGRQATLGRSLRSCPFRARPGPPAAPCATEVAPAPTEVGRPPWLPGRRHRGGLVRGPSGCLAGRRRVGPTGGHRVNRVLATGTCQPPRGIRLFPSC